MGVHAAQYMHTIRSMSHFLYSFLVSPGDISVLPEVNTLGMTSIGGDRSCCLGTVTVLGTKGRYSSLALFLCAVSYRPSTTHLWAVPWAKKLSHVSK